MRQLLYYKTAYPILKYIRYKLAKWENKRFRRKKFKQPLYNESRRCIKRKNNTQLSKKKFKFQALDSIINITKSKCEKSSNWTAYIDKVMDDEEINKYIIKCTYAAITLRILNAIKLNFFFNVVCMWRKKQFPRFEMLLDVKQNK